MNDLRRELVGRWIRMLDESLWSGLGWIAAALILAGLMISGHALLFRRIEH